MARTVVVGTWVPLVMACPLLFLFMVLTAIAVLQTQVKTGTQRHPMEFHGSWLGQRIPYLEAISWCVPFHGEEHGRRKTSLGADSRSWVLHYPIFVCIPKIRTPGLLAAFPESCISLGCCPG